MQRDEWRLIGWIALAQVMGLVLGWVALTITMKFSGYPSDHFVWDPMPVRLREHGHWFLFVTALWSAAIFLFGRFNWLIGAKILAIAGILLVIVIPALFLYSLANLYRRPLLIGTPPAAGSPVDASKAGGEQKQNP